MEGHYNSSYFWTPIPTVTGQFENVMFINKIKEQLLSEKSCPPQHSLPLHLTPSPLTPNQGVDIKTIHTQTGSTEHVMIPPLNTSALLPGLAIAPSPATLNPHPQQPSLTLPASLLASDGAPPPQEKPPAPQASDPPKTGGGRKSGGRDDGEGEREGPDVENGGREGRSYRCRSCPLTFYSKTDLQVHIKGHPEPKPHHCPHCSKTFANSSYLSQHARIHSGAKPYTCTYCQKTFRQLSHLQQHTRIHTGDRPYKCVQPGCEKSFTQLSNLQSHRRQHNKDKPFKCQHCHRAYTDSPSLQTHLATHTVKHTKAYGCLSCRKSYTSETYLMKHMRKHKGPEQTQDSFGIASPGSGSGSAPSQAPNSEPPQCSFDLFKPDPHKDPCLTVSAGVLHIEPMGSS